MFGTRVKQTRTWSGSQGWAGDTLSGRRGTTVWVIVVLLGNEATRRNPFPFVDWDSSEVEITWIKWIKEIHHREITSQLASQDSTNGVFRWRLIGTPVTCSTRTWRRVLLTKRVSALSRHDVLVTLLFGRWGDDMSDMMKTQIRWHVHRLGPGVDATTRSSSTALRVQPS